MQSGKTDVILKTLVDNGQEKSDRYVELLVKEAGWWIVKQNSSQVDGQEMKEYEMQ